MMSDEKFLEEKQNTDPQTGSSVPVVEKETHDDLEKMIQVESSSISDEKAGVIKSEKPGLTGKALFLLGLTILLSLSALVAVGLVGYFGFAQIQTMSERLVTIEQQKNNSLSVANKTKETLDNNFFKLQTQIQQTLNRQQADNEKNLQEIILQLSATKRQLNAVGGRHKSDWLLAEADYLVRIATNRLLLEGDHVTALALLLSADERILLMDDPVLQPIREALARDMATLRLVTRADIAGLAIRISSLIPQIKVLPLRSFEIPEQTSNDVGREPAVTDTDWQENLKNTLSDLSVKWFEVKDHGRPVKPLMASETETVLLTNMSLLLQTTQFATLRRHSELYHHSLQQLQDWTNEYFDTADPVVQAFIKEIDLLNATSVKINLPKTLESRLILTRQVELMLKQSETQTNTGTGAEQ